MTGWQITLKQAGFEKMIKCIECLRLISDMIDDELGLQQSRSLLERVSGYEECLACLNTMKKTVSLYRSFSSIEVPREVHASFWETIEVEIHKTMKSPPANRRKTVRK